MHLVPEQIFHYSIIEIRNMYALSRTSVIREILCQLAILSDIVASLTRCTCCIVASG